MLIYSNKRKEHVPVGTSMVTSSITYMIHDIKYFSIVLYNGPTVIITIIFTILYQMVQDFLV